MYPRRGTRRGGPAAAAGIVLALVASRAAGTTLSPNGGFGAGDFTGWVTDVPSGASATVVSSYEETTSPSGVPPKTWLPTEGGKFALLKTDGPDSYTRVYRGDVDAAAGWELRFDWFFDAEDFAPYSDQVRYRVLDSAGAEVHSEVLASISGGGGGIAVGDYARTGWWTETYTFASPGTYTFAYELANVGDSVFDSHAGLDNVRLIPEPVTMLGVFLGVGGLGAYVRRRTA